MVWLWDADAAQAFLASFGISREIPGLDGPALLLRVDQLGFSDAEKEHVQAALSHHALTFMQRESLADVPFLPPDVAVRNCIYRWDNAAVRAALDGLDVPEAVCHYQTLCM